MPSWEEVAPSPPAFGAGTKPSVPRFASSYSVRMGSVLGALAGDAHWGGVVDGGSVLGWPSVTPPGAILLLQPRQGQHQEIVSQHMLTMTMATDSPLRSPERTPDQPSREVLSSSCNHGKVSTKRSCPQHTSTRGERCTYAGGCAGGCCPGCSTPPAVYRKRRPGAGRSPKP